MVVQYHRQACKLDKMAAESMASDVANFYVSIWEDNAPTHDLDWMNTNEHIMEVYAHYIDVRVKFLQARIRRHLKRAGSRSMHTPGRKTSNERRRSSTGLESNSSSISKHSSQNVNYEITGISQRHNEFPLLDLLDVPPPSPPPPPPETRPVHSGDSVGSLVGKVQPDALQRTWPDPVALYAIAFSILMSFLPVAAVRTLS